MTRTRGGGTDDEHATPPSRSGVEDWRLAPAAVAVWAVCWWSVAAAPGQVAVVGATALAAATLAAGWWLAARVARRRLARRRLPALVVVLAAVAATALGTSTRLADRHEGAVAELAGRDARVSVVLTVTGDPRPVGAPARGQGRPGVVVPARVVEGRWRGTSLAGGAPVLVVAGPEWSGVRWGARYRAAGTLSEPRDRADGHAAVLRPRLAPREVQAPGLPWRAAERVREGLAAAAGGLPGPAPGLLPSLALGDTRAMPEALQEDMRDAGLAHLSAVSGANVTITCGTVVALLGWAGARPWLRAAAGAACLAALVVTARPEPSVLRAAVMGSVGLLGLVAGRPGRAPAALSAACLVLLAADPWLARSFGLGLSVAATAGIVLWARPLARWLRRRRLLAPVADPVAVTLAAQAAVTPVLVLLDPVLTPYAVVANVLVGPVVAPTTLLTTAAAAVSAVSPAAATVLLWPAGLGAAWIALVARIAAHAPGARLPWPEGLPGAAVAAAVVVVVAVAVRGAGAVRRIGEVRRIGWARRTGAARDPGAGRRAGVDTTPAVGPAGAARSASTGPTATGRRRRLVLAVAGGLLLVLAVAPCRPSGGSWVPADWSVVACDVGQGEALLVRAGPRAAVVLDTGPDPQRVGRCLRAARVDAVPLLVLTHFHADHVDGVPAVLDAAAVGEVWHGPALVPAPRAEATVRRLSVLGVPARAPQPGERARAGDAVVTALWPDRVADPAAAAAGDGTAVNDASLVVRVDTDRGDAPVAVIALGDVEVAAQAGLARVDASLLDVDVTTIAHHGSASQVPGLYERLSPLVAVASAGAGNAYGHPDDGTLAMVGDTGARVLVTARTGGTAVVTESDGLRVTSERRADRSGRAPPRPGVAGCGPCRQLAGPVARRRRVGCRRSASPPPPWSSSRGPTRPSRTSRSVGSVPG